MAESGGRERRRARRAGSATGPPDAAPADAERGGGVGGTERRRARRGGGAAEPLDAAPVDVERGDARRAREDCLASVVPEAPALRRERRDAHLLEKRTAAAVRMQAAFRARRARRAARARAERPRAATLAEFRSSLEPYVSAAIATTVAVQWDETFVHLLGAEQSRPGFSALNALGSSLYAAVLYLLLLNVQGLLNARLVNLIRQALQILVGWAWRGVVVAVDARITAHALDQPPAVQRAIRTGYMAGWSLAVAPAFTGLIVVLMRAGGPGAAKPTFAQRFFAQCAGLLLGASALMIGFSWHQTFVHASEGLTVGRSNLRALRLVAAAVRSALFLLVLGALKAKTPLAHASRVHRAPRPSESLRASFLEQSVFVGGKSLSFICAFSLFSIVRALAGLCADELGGWGEYAVYTGAFALLLAFASALAFLGPPRALCCARVGVLADAELLFYSTIAIQLGWATQSSYQLLVARTLEEQRRGVFVTALGASLMLTVWLLIAFTAVFGRVQRTREQERRLAQL